MFSSECNMPRNTSLAVLAAARAMFVVVPKFDYQNSLDLQLRNRCLISTSRSLKCKFGSISPSGSRIAGVLSAFTLMALIHSSSAFGQAVPSFNPHHFYVLSSKTDESTFLASHLGRDGNNRERWGLVRDRTVSGMLNIDGQMRKIEGSVHNGGAWKITHIDGHPGYFRLTTLEASQSGPRYLDTSGDESNTFFFAEGDGPLTTGQMWKFDPVPDQPGFYRITNKFLEGRRAIDMRDIGKMGDATGAAVPEQMFRVKLFNNTLGEVAEQNEITKLFATSYIAPTRIFRPTWKTSKNPEKHEYVLEGQYPILNLDDLGNNGKPDDTLTFRAMKDDASVLQNGPNQGKLRIFDDVVRPVRLHLDTNADDSDDAVANDVTMRARANVEFTGDRRTVTLSDLSTFVNSRFVGPANGGSDQAVGFFMEKLVIKYTNLSSGWGQPIYGPGTANGQVGYNINTTTGVNFDLNSLGPGVGINSSTNRGSSTNVDDYKYMVTFARDNVSPVYAWTLGNVYDGDNKAVAYDGVERLLHRKKVGEKQPVVGVKGTIDRVLDVPNSAKGTFIPVAYCGWTAPVSGIKEDLKIKMEYEITYREVHLKPESDPAKQFQDGFRRGFLALFSEDFYDDPGKFFSDPSNSYSTTVVTLKFGQVVTVPRHTIVTPLAE